MFRFTIRDIGWLFLVIAVALGWWRQHRREIAQQRAFDSERRELLSAKNIIPDGYSGIAARHIAGNWHAYARSNDYDVGLDDDVRHTGRCSVFIRAKTDIPDGAARIGQLIRADQYCGQRLRLAGFVKGTDVGRASLFLRLLGGELGERKTQLYSYRISGTMDWEIRDIVVDIPLDTSNIEIGLWAWGCGQVWCDDLQLEIVDSTSYPRAQTAIPLLPVTPIPVPSNLDFEQAVSHESAPN